MAVILRFSFERVRGEKDLLSPRLAGFAGGEGEDGSRRASAGASASAGADREGGGRIAAGERGSRAWIVDRGSRIAAGEHVLVDVFVLRGRERVS
jgi:hypothetical protein